MLKGSADTSASLAANAIIATVPANMRPSSVALLTAWYSGAAGLFDIHTDGTITIVSSWSSVYSAQFGGVTYAAT